MISNLANDMYAKDASVKMTSAMKIKMESGEMCIRDSHIGGHIGQSILVCKSPDNSLLHILAPVSYTHLDVYKRQVFKSFHSGK